MKGGGAIAIWAMPVCFLQLSLLVSEHAFSPYTDSLSKVSAHYVQLHLQSVCTLSETTLAKCLQPNFYQSKVFPSLLLKKNKINNHANNKVSIADQRLEQRHEEIDV